MSSRTEKILFRGKVEHRDAAGSLLFNSGDTVLVQRGKPRLLVIRCPCGCGDDLLINLDKRAGAAWRYYKSRRGLTLYPSYWRDTRCGSHFIIWNDRIYWCYGWESEDDYDWSVSADIEGAVLKLLPSDRFMKCEELADRLGLIPWEALQACHQLVNRGLAVAGRGQLRGEYRRL
jgi:hypothetical protein